MSRILQKIQTILEVSHSRSAEKEDHSKPERIELVIRNERWR